MLFSCFCDLCFQSVTELEISEKYGPVEALVHPVLQHFQSLLADVFPVGNSFVGRLLLVLELLNCEYCKG